MSMIQTRLSPVSAEYDSDGLCYVVLRIYAGKLHPDEVTTLLKIAPTVQNKIGEKRINRVGRSRVATRSSWFLCSEEFVCCQDLRGHLDWIIDQLKSAQEGLYQLQHMQDVKLILSCIWINKHEKGGPVLWPEHMRALANLDLKCAFEVTFL